MQDIITFLTQHATLSIAIFSIFILLILIETMRAKRHTFNINPTQLTQLINKENAVVIDLRSQEAYRNGHIIGAQHFSINDMKQPAKKLEKLKQKPIIIITQTNPESQKIAAQLLKQGYNAYSLNGGMRAWVDAQMPLVTN
jgi:rhodanese-related sulfurtransferase